MTSHRRELGAALESILLDFRFAVRQLLRAPAFTVAAVAMLALGIGVNTAVFALADAMLFKGFRLVERNDRILYIHSELNGQYSGVSYPDFQDWRSEAHSFDGMGAVADLRIILNDPNGFPERYTATQITVNGFHLLGQQPVLGRDFTPSDAVAGAPPVAILSYGFWQRRFGKDPNIIGRMIGIQGMPSTTVVGVMPDGFSFPQNQDLWVPLVPDSSLQKRDARDLWFAFGRLRDSTSIENARAELQTIGSHLAAAYPETNRAQVPRPNTFAEFFIGPHAVATYGMIWVAVGFVLLIACANLANLLLARMRDRSREISQRIALGASRWRIVRQTLIEIFLFSIGGAVLGWWIAGIGVRIYAVATSPAISEWRRDLLDYTMDYRVLMYLAAISIGSGLLFGLVPALRYSKLDLNDILKSGGSRATGSRQGKPLTATLLIAEMAMSIALLAGAGAMAHSFLNIYAANVGADIVGVRAMLIHLPEAQNSGHEKRVAFFDQLQTRLESLPGVEFASIGNSPAGGIPRPRSYELPGTEAIEEQRRPAVVMQTIGPDYFRTFNAAVSGREFDRFDSGSSAPVAIVNQRFADAHWPGQTAIGQRLRLFDNGTAEAWRTIVGVAPNITYDPARQEITPVVYVPFGQRPGEADMWVHVRTHLPAGALAASFRHEIRAIDPDVAIWLGPYNLVDRLASVSIYSDVRTHAALLLIFAAVALVLASAGVYAVAAHSVNQRIQEIGIRMAIGATTYDIAGLVFRLVISPLLAGLALGMAGAFALNRVLSSELVRVSPADPMAFIAAGAVLATAAASGCWIPARRAMRVDPAVALRHS